MGITREQLQKMALQIDEVVYSIQQQDVNENILLQDVCAIYRESAKNLMHYTAFRSFDARKMQKGLKQLGLTRLANAEGNILGSLINLKIILHSLLGGAPDLKRDGFLSIGEGSELLKKHTDELFGDNDKTRRVRIMVTQPTEAATDYDMVLDMVRSGMDCARVNCAHDDPEVWEAIIENVRRAANECSTTVKVAMDLAGSKVRTGKIPLEIHKKGKSGSKKKRKPFILLNKGDYLIVSCKGNDAAHPVYDKKGFLVKPARIGCVPPQIIGRVEKGAPILFDDGKIEGEIIDTSSDSFQVKITRSQPGGTKLKGEKGINLPTLDLGISGLTTKDREDLKFVVQHADIVNYSYVNDANDVNDLLLELKKLGADEDLGVILKIETNLAYKNLINILITAMQRKHLGVMIARGDLALEVGWKNMGMVQEGILSFCSAAHIPVVWATQVLEGLAKKGMPSRSEITDITSSVQAECVMLNKGPHINEAIAFLDEVLLNVESSHHKKEVLLPRMEWI
ncbi:pyruvate kinase [Flagellimonas oceanensis]|uniref:pyruvate kinase n=1 Tax=Flagellimonas oceanensis TaxID=2499163 RepID=UPI000F8EDF1B|nr:pyruvate kinase [Allomuricauda oceanensis]|tara:strand:- start:9480 stop:11012 length:1533 start_codon:yes stop_codon:yes gene_type:complete